MAQARLSLLAVVESEDCGDHVQEVRRDPHMPNAVSEAPAGIRDRRRELGIERCLQVLQATRRFDEPVFNRSREVILRREGDDRRDRGLVDGNDRDGRVFLRIHRRLLDRRERVCGPFGAR